jgi:hypothetical protein
MDPASAGTPFLPEVQTLRLEVTMKLLTKAVLKGLPALYDTESVSIEDKILVVKFFTPDSNWTWYGVEYDPEEQRFFGFVKGMSSEWGYFTLRDMEENRGPMGLKIERDMNWKPIKFEELPFDPYTEDDAFPRTPVRVKDMRVTAV